MVAPVKDYFNTRMGVEILKSAIKTASIPQDLKDRVLLKISRDLSAANIVKYAAATPKGKPALHLPSPLALTGLGLLSSAAAIPYVLRGADEYHSSVYKMPQLRTRPKVANEGTLAGILSGSGLGFGKEFVKELSRGVSQGPLTGLSYKLSKNLYNLPTRVRADEAYGKSLYETFGKETGSLMARRVEEYLRQRQSVHIDRNVYSPMRKQIFDALLKGPNKDEEIARAIAEGRTDPNKLWNLYKTMVRFAPKLSTDLNAVKSFFRGVIHVGDGETVDPVTIKQLADTEAAVNKAMEGYNA